MGSVIHLSHAAPGAGPRRSGGARRSTASGRRRRETALVLGGGGITGAAYHLGVLNALNAVSAERTVNDFDLYVGTSSGAVIAACLANGIEPETLALANIDRAQ